MRHAVVVLPAAKTSNELDLIRAMPDWEAEVIATRGLGPADAEHHLDALRFPGYPGRPERWSAALAWHRGLSSVALTDVDVVISNELHSPVSAQAARLARSLDAPHVIEIAETMAHSPLYRLPPWGWHARARAHSAQRFVCLTERARTHAVSLGCDPARCDVIHGGVDTNHYRPRAAGLVAEPIAVFVGELRPGKGVLDVVAAADRARATTPGIRLVIAGRGPLEEQVVALAADRDHVDYLGAVERERVAEVMRGGRMLVVAPFTQRVGEEQFGYVYVEAMACGLPVITTRCGAIPEVVPAGNAIVDEGDVDGLAAAMVRFAGPVAEESGRVNRDVAVERYDLGRQGRRLAAIMSEVVDAWHAMRTR
jgi:glycosyltransferase involved in cell wall biosynthesis